MPKTLYIAEKPSVALEFAKALHINGARSDGYLESNEAVVTWCVGHLVTMSYPEAYDPALKRWSLDTLPFLPERFRYEVIGSVKKQFGIVKGLLNRKDIDTIYVCTDSGREGEYIYRLVAQEAGVKGKVQKRVWIDSQTEEEINKGIREAKDITAYDNLAASAYLRAKEDYLMGINFSRLLTLKYGNTLSGLMKTDHTVLSVGRVMTCVLGMVVRREREIRDFTKTPFYRVMACIACGDHTFRAEWRAVHGSRYENSPMLYKENGFREQKDAEQLIRELTDTGIRIATVKKIERKQEKKNPPLLFNLAELQNVCSRELKLSPDETLKIVQELYEKKLVTYPRTDARVLSSAIAKEIHKNIGGLKAIPGVRDTVEQILQEGTCKNIGKTKYTDDKQITDHYAIIPTGQGIGGLSKMSETHVKVYERIVRRFLSIFLPPAIYQKYSLELQTDTEHFFAAFKVLTDPGYLKVAAPWTLTDKNTSRGEENVPEKRIRSGKGEDMEEEDIRNDAAFLDALNQMKKGDQLPIDHYEIKEGETSPPKRYTSGSMILAMENAGQLIEDEELRSMIKGSGIGTSATRAEILKKLVTIRYLDLAKKTQVITPSLLGELVYDAVDLSIRQLLNAELTASWEKGLTGVADGSITEAEYMEKLKQFIIRRTTNVLEKNNSYELRNCFAKIEGFYRNGKPVRKEKAEA